MQQLPLQAIPNQSFTAQLDNREYEIFLKEINGLMAATIIRDNITIVEGQRILPDHPILPYKYQEEGNFVLTTNNGEYPYYTQFDITQFLIYASQAEIEVIRAS